MNKTTLILPTVTLIVGITIGHSMHGKRSTPVEMETGIPKSTEHEARAEPSQSREKELLLLAIQEMNLTKDDLEAAETYIRKLERNAERYNRLEKQWKEKGFGFVHALNFGWGGFGGFGGMGPGTDLISFFGWDEEQIQDIQRVTQNSEMQIKNWESSHAVCLEDSEKNKVVELPALPEEFKIEYMNAIETILPADDFELLASSISSVFDEKSSPREIALSIGPYPEHMQQVDPSTRNKECIILSVTPLGDSKPNPTTSITDYAPGFIFEWSHVFNMTPNAFTPEELEAADLL